MPIEYQFHKYADFFPLIEGAEFEALVEDIRRFGIREKIWLFQNQILDGRNRYRACMKSSVMPQFRQFVGSEEDALNAVMSWNLERRHLNVGQRALIAVEILPELERFARENQKRKSNWIAQARQEFTPGQKKDCAVCNYYAQLCHAHHVFPLYLQYGLLESACHEFIWLCPTHHSAIHAIIDSLVRWNPAPRINYASTQEEEILDRLSVRFVELWGSAKRGACS